MQTVRDPSGMGILPSGYVAYSAPTQAPVAEIQAKRLKIREFKSWSVCLSVIVLLTGLIKVFNLGITMESVTSLLFFTSLSGLAYFIYRIISLSRTPVPLNTNSLHELN